MKSLTYNQTLQIIDRFMEDSGIRKFCTNVCQGKCCKTCSQDSPECCMVTGDTRLSCSIYICNSLAKTIFSRREYKIFYKIQETILLITYKHRQKEKSLQAMYYYLPSPEIKKEKFSRYVCALNKFNRKRIKEKIKKY